MPQTDDPEVFRERWKSHINEVTQLGHTATEEQFEQVKQKRDELNELVDEIADTYAEEQADG